MINTDQEIKVYIVDDDKELLKAIVQSFELEQFNVVPVSRAEDLLQHISMDFNGIIITDVRMPKMDGLSFFQEVKKIDGEIPVVFLTGHADVPMVLSMLHEGAFDFFSKPVDTEHLLSTAKRAIASRRLVLENRRLKSLIKQTSNSIELIGESASLVKLRMMAHQIATSPVDVLIEGETGTGKGALATLLYELSERSGQKFVNVNCAAIPGEMAKCELFGYDINSSRHSGQRELGKIEQANRGTLFLNGVENLPLDIQGQLVPVVSKRQLSTSATISTKSLDIRIIASSQKDLSALVEQGSFRADLLYHLNTVQFKVPPLRNRREDVPLLFAHFLTLASNKYGKDIPDITYSTHQKLIEYQWPGNVRELKNFAESIVLGVENILGKNEENTLSLRERVERFERNVLVGTLEEIEGDVRSALDKLRIPRKTFYDKLSRHDIDIADFRKAKDSRYV